ncbi:MAG: hypothetical protein SCH68_12370 [Brevefilum sp.]|nr:hypothetical protein [Brevefilum sp.]
MPQKRLQEWIIFSFDGFEHRSMVTTLPDLVLSTFLFICNYSACEWIGSVVWRLRRHTTLPAHHQQVYLSI